MARLQLAKSETLQSLSEARLEQLSLLLSSPEAYPIVDRPVRLPSNVVLPKDDSATSEPAPKMDDPLEGLLLDNEMTRKVRRDIQKMFRLGLRRGIRHAKGLPLRKRRFSHNGMTARRLNQLERVN